MRNIIKIHILVPIALISLLLAIPLTTPKVIYREKAVSLTYHARHIKPVNMSPKPIVSTPIITASYTCGQYADLFNRYNWNVRTALAICQAESSGVPTKVSDPGLNYDHIPDFGLMQLHGIEILDPAQNVSYAYYHKYLTQGWAAWSTYQSGAYLKFL